MTKKDLLKAILLGAAAFVPGGNQITAGVEAVINRNEDPDDDVEELADAISAILVGSILAAEGLKEKDIVHEETLAQIVENIKGDIRLYTMLVKRLKPPTPVADATGVPV